MGRKKLEKNEAVLEDKPKKRGRPKVSEGAPSSPKLEKKKKVKSIYDEDGEMLSLDDIKNSLLKKAKSSGIIDQSDIYDALNQFDLDDDTIADLINFFKENGIEAEKVNKLYEGRPGDDTTIAVMRLARPHTVNLMIGPPSSADLDGGAAFNRRGDKSSHRISCFRS